MEKLFLLIHALHCNLPESRISNKTLTRGFTRKSPSQGNDCQRNRKKSLQGYSPDKHSPGISGLSVLHPPSALWLRLAVLCALRLWARAVRFEMNGKGLEMGHWHRAANVLGAQENTRV
jgi:hypothetical protein